MKKQSYWMGVLIVLILTGGAFFLLRPEPPPPPEPVVTAPVAEVPPAPGPAPEPEPVQYPVPEPPTEEAPAEAPEAAPAEEPPPPLPELEVSDEVVRKSVAELVGVDALARFLVSEEIIRRAVVTVDNVPREKIALRQRAVPPVKGKFTTSGEEEELVLAPENYARYTPFVELVQALDMHNVATVYFHLYPLFQEAYEDLGYPGAYFNDRLVEVIDHLLETPDLAGPLRLVRPSVYYKFADPELEGLSTGQKTLLRMGNANAVIIKRKLRELRRQVTGAPQGEG